MNKIFLKEPIKIFKANRNKKLDLCKFSQFANLQNTINVFKI